MRVPQINENSNEHGYTQPHLSQEGETRNRSNNRADDPPKDDEERFKHFSRMTKKKKKPRRVRRLKIEIMVDDNLRVGWIVHAWNRRVREGNGRKQNCGLRRPGCSRGTQEVKPNEPTRAREKEGWAGSIKATNHTDWDRSPYWTKPCFPHGSPLVRWGDLFEEEMCSWGKATHSPTFCSLVSVCLYTSFRWLLYSRSLQ